MPDRYRLRVLYTGRVQGVGFRDTARRALRRHDVTGYVRNLPDGRVELVVEGDPAATDAALAAVAERMRGHIDSADRQTLPATGEFQDFDVRRRPPAHRVCINPV